LTIEIDTTETDNNTGHTRDVNRRSARTIATPHAKTKRIGIDTEITNLTKTIGDMPRLPMARTVRVDIKLTMWRRRRQDLLARTLTALILPSRKSKGFESHLPQESILIVPILQAMMRKIITLDTENPQARLIRANGDANPLLQPPHMDSVLTMSSLPPRQAITMVGLGSPLLSVSLLLSVIHLQRISTR
jgi:hypothetical protein